MSLARLTQLFEKSSDSDGQIATSTYDYKKIHRGEIFNFNEYDTDTDIASPKQISIQTGDKPAAVTLDLAVSGAVTVALGEGMVVGTGGSANAGTAVTGYCRNRRRKHQDNTIGVVVKKDFVYGSSNNTAGTVLHTDYMPAATQGALKVGSVGRSSTAWILRENCLYSLVITAIADNTVMSWNLDIHEES